MTMTETGAGRRSAEVEAWLDERRVPWVFEPALPMASIDRVASLANQARLEPLNAEVVERYAADMERGDLFPPIVVRRVASRRAERLVVLGGNHRTAAAGQAGVKTLPAYVVECESEMALRLTYEDNRRHGLPPSEEERLFQAVHLVNGGFTHVDAARTCGLPLHKLRMAITVAAADRRAAALGVVGWDRLSAAARARVGPLQADAVFVAVARLAVDANLGTPAISALLVKVRNTRSEADALEVVAAEAEALSGRIHSTAGGMVKKATPRSRLLSGLSSVVAVAPAEVVASCADAEARRALAKRIDASVAHLEAVRRLLR